MKRTKIEVVDSRDGRYVGLRLTVSFHDKEGKPTERSVFIPEEDTEELLTTEACKVLAEWRPRAGVASELRDQARREKQEQRERERSERRGRRSDDDPPRVGTHRFTKRRNDHRR